MATVEKGMEFLFIKENVEIFKFLLRQVSGMKYSNKMSAYHLACENRGFK